MGGRNLQAVFASGELSPRLTARFDFEKYKTGCETVENFKILPQGGASRRGGTHFVAEVKTSSLATRVIAFEFSTTQAYILEFGNLYVRFYKDNGRIESPPGTPVELVTTYATADLLQLKTSQSADTMYIVHNTYLPRKLTRTSHTAWTITDVAFTDGPYLDENTDTAKLLTVSTNAVGAGATMTASGTLTFSAGMVGSLWRVKGVTTYGYVKVTAYIDATRVTVEVKTVLDFVTPGTTTTSRWREAAWAVTGSMGTTIGYPAAVGFYEQRLVFGATTNQPQTFWGSKSASYEDFTPGTTAGDPYTYTIGTNQVNAIRWITPARIMIVGTVGSELSVSGGSTSGITPSNIFVKDETRYGSNTVQALRIGAVVVFVQRNGKKIRHIQYASDKDSYTAFDVTLLSEHITGTGGIVDMAFQQEPDATICFVRSDGEMAVCTYYPDQEVLGWARWITDGNFESVAAIPTSTNDQMWTVVKRNINGSTRRFIEYFDDTLYVDCGLTYNGTNTTTTLTPAAITGTGILFTAGASVFTAADIGKTLVNLSTTTDPDTDEVTLNGGRATITAQAGTTATADIVVNFPGITAIPASSWGLGVDTFTGLSHLNGEEVTINGDAAAYNNQTVSAGAITVDGTEPEVVIGQVGLAYTPLLKTLHPERAEQDGPSSARRRRLIRPYIRLLSSLGGTINGEVLPSRSSADVMGSAPALYTGLRTLANTGWSPDGGQITVTQPQPLPMTILEVGGYLEVGE